MNRTFFRWIGTRSKRERKFRLVRCIRWVGTVGDGRGHSTMHTLALVPSWWRVESAYEDFALTVAGVRYHWQRSYGGKHV